MGDFIREILKRKKPLLLSQLFDPFDPLAVFKFFQVF